MARLNDIAETWYVILVGTFHCSIISLVRTVWYGPCPDTTPYVLMLFYPELGSLLIHK